MSTVRASRRVQAPTGPANAMKAVAREAAALFDAILHPGQAVSEVEEWQTLRREADRIAGLDPARADVLRRRAARIGRP